METKKLVLVIDDRERTVRAVKRVLEREGYEISVAYDGLTGLEKAVKEQPDLILLDVMMPGMDGYEVCRRLQIHSRTDSIPVLMLTGKGNLDFGHRGFPERVREREEGFESGATEFLSKPIRSKELIKRVKSLLWAGDQR